MMQEAVLRMYVPHGANLRLSPTSEVEAGSEMGFRPAYSYVKWYYMSTIAVA